MAFLLKQATHRMLLVAASATCCCSNLMLQTVSLTIVKGHNAPFYMSCSAACARFGYSKTGLVYALQTMWLNAAESHIW